MNTNHNYKIMSMKPMTNPLTEPSRHPLWRLFNQLCFGRPAAAQQFLSALAAEWKRRLPRPVCPTCSQPMVRTRAELDTTTLACWTCECA